MPDGTYTLQSEATDGAGFQGSSTPVTVVVDNPPPTTTIAFPSNGATVSGTQVTLDAAATLNVSMNRFSTSSLAEP